MEGGLQAGPLEDGVVLGILLGEGIARDPMMLEEFLDLHRAGTIPSIIFLKPSALAATVAAGP